MPLQRVKFQPTMVANNTELAADGAWRLGDKVRFKNGLPETIGGWQRANNQEFLGTCRALIPWTTLDGEELIGVGTHLKYYVERGGVYYDVTPVRESQALTDPYETVIDTLAADITAADTQLTLTDASKYPTTGAVQIDSEEIIYSNKAGNTLLGLTRGVNGTTAAAHTATANAASRYVRVTDTAHGAITNDYVTMSGSSAVGGVSAGALDGEHQIEIGGSDFYYFDAEEYPTSAATGGGAVTADYQVNTGQEYFVQGVGWGAGGFGLSGFGAAAATGAGQQMRIWNHQNFGEDLIFGPRGGGMFYWDASAGFTTRGGYLSNLASAADVPTVQNQLIVTESRFVMAFGANPAGSSVQDPMLIRWSDQELAQVWTELPTNLAGSLRLTVGTEIITAVETRNEILVWTDAALYSLQFSPEFGFVQTLLDRNISIAGPNAVVLADNAVFWMGRNKFYVYDGRVNTLPSTVDDYVFENFNSDQNYQVFAGSNEAFDEVWWFYPTESELLNDAYVTFNYVEKGWTVGTMTRTAWVDANIREYPLAAGGNRLYYHELGVDDGTDTNLVAMVSYIESSDFGIGEGEFYMLVSRILPDMSFSRSTAVTPRATLSLLPRTQSGRPYRAETPTQDVTRSATVPIEQYTEQVDVRVRGRQMKLKIQGSTLGSAWRLGTPRLDARPNGRRA